VCPVYDPRLEAPQLFKYCSQAATRPDSAAFYRGSTRLISVRSGACSMEDGPHAAHLAVRLVRNSALPISAGPPPSNSRYVAASRTLACCLTRCAFFVGVCVRAPYDFMVVLTA
jgi:hypothetical protein